MNKLYKNRYVMDKKTGLVFRCITSKACEDGRRWVESSRINDMYGKLLGGKKYAKRCQIKESQLIPINKTEGIIAWEAERIMRGKCQRDAVDQTILALHKIMLESRGFSRGKVEAIFAGASN